MTKLELMICEAENSGEIDLDTRDMMLNVLNESTAQYRAVKRIDDGVNKISKKIERLENIAQSYDEQGNTRMYAATKQKIEKLWDEARKLNKKIVEIDPYGHAYGSKEFGSEAGRNRKESSPREFVDSMALTTPGLQTSRLQEQ